KRRGIARAALAAIRRLLPWATLHAWVHPENTASQRLFESAGFHQVEGHYVSPPPASREGRSRTNEALPGGDRGNHERLCQRESSQDGLNDLAGWTMRLEGGSSHFNHFCREE